MRDFHEEIRPGQIRLAPEPRQGRRSRRLARPSRLGTHHSPESAHSPRHPAVPRPHCHLPGRREESRRWEAASPGPQPPLPASVRKRCRGLGAQRLQPRPLPPPPRTLPSPASPAPARLTSLLEPIAGLAKLNNWPTVLINPLSVKNMCVVSVRVYRNMVCGGRVPEAGKRICPSNPLQG